MTLSQVLQDNDEDVREGGASSFGKTVLPEALKSVSSSKKRP